MNGYIHSTINSLPVLLSIKCDHRGRGRGGGGGRERERERVMPDESFTGLFSPTLIIVSIQFSINDVL